ncbi:putative metal ion binding protein 1 [Elsinoe australis]|uniref:Putative metal ion binding protein 1 n=1 Tax=Elsinoe australis TaxID=40998 RepID=A0A4U7BCJ9_9PEZI|nr:putative metal ion binding protein 1 [Elsinoe australis]
MSQPAQNAGDNMNDAVKTAPRATNATANKTCRYFGSKSGCKAGDKCPYKHEVSANTTSQTATSKQASQRSHAPQPPDQNASTKHPTQRRFQAPAVPASRVVKRPVPAAQLEDPRDFQLGQIRRRFAPNEKEESSGTSFSFGLTPTDPDFPYEIDALQCLLIVPHDYPASSKPKLRITNKEMRRGFQLNVETGFDEIAATAPNATLLGLMNRLDKSLANLLSRPMAETVKLYRHAGGQEPSKAPHVDAISIQGKAMPQPKATGPARPPSPTYTETDKAQAVQKRQSDIRQLVARLGKSPGFNQSSDGVSFTLPPSVFRMPTATMSIQRATSLQLIVPELYNLVPCRIRFGGERTEDVQNLEAAFEARVKEQRSGTLLAHVNYLSLNLKSMAAQTRSDAATKTTAPPVQAPQAKSQPTEALPVRPVELQDSDKSHIKVIPRPLEWSQAQSGETDSSDDSYTEDSDVSDDEEAEHTDSATTAPTTGVAEKGIMLSFPNLELHGIELLELQSLGLTVKCDRCKELNDFERIRNNAKGDHTGMKEANCKKCGSSLAVGFRIHEVKFLMVSAAAERATKGPVRRKVKESLGIVAGQELPRRGKCQHYSKNERQVEDVEERSSQVQAATWREAKDDLSLYLGDTAMSAIEVV